MGSSYQSHGECPQYDTLYHWNFHRNWIFIIPIAYWHALTGLILVFQSIFYFRRFFPPGHSPTMLKSSLPLILHSYQRCGGIVLSHVTFVVGNFERIFITNLMDDKLWIQANTLAFEKQIFPILCFTPAWWWSRWYRRLFSTHTHTLLKAYYWAVIFAHWHLSGAGWTSCATWMIESSNRAKRKATRSFHT